jgi:hypothetical protein
VLFDVMLRDAAVLPVLAKHDLAHLRLRRQATKGLSADSAGLIRPRRGRLPGVIGNTADSRPPVGGGVYAHAVRCLYSLAAAM